MLYMSFYNQAKKKFKIKSVASENDKAWCSQCKMKGHYRNSWKCPNSDKEIILSHPGADSAALTAAAQPAEKR